MRSRARFTGFFVLFIVTLIYIFSHSLLRKETKTLINCHLIVSIVSATSFQYTHKRSRAGRILAPGGFYTFKLADFLIFTLSVGKYLQVCILHVCRGEYLGGPYVKLRRSQEGPIFYHDVPSRNNFRGSKL